MANWWDDIDGGDIWGDLTGGLAGYDRDTPGDIGGKPGSGGGGKGGGGKGGGGKGGGGSGGGKPKPDPDPIDAGRPSGSATAIIAGVLDSYGLGSLADWAWRRWTAGDSVEEIMLKMRARPEYIERFPAMAELGQRGLGITEGDYISYERAVGNLSARYGIPAGVYTDRQAIAKLMLNNLSPVEIEQNMARASAVVYGQPEIRAAFAQFYGAQGDGAAIAFFLDPDAAQPVLEQQYAATQIAGNAMVQGLGVTKTEAERIAGLVNPNEEQAQRAATVAGTQRELFANLIGESGAPTAGQGISAALGADAADVDAVERRRSQRSAAYQEGGSYAAGAAGVSGLGTARR